MSRDSQTHHPPASPRHEPEIIYQIFPDRFRCARPETNPTPGAWHYHGKPIGVSTERTLLCNSPTDQFTFMGGDLEGIRQSLPYLRELGVTSVYLNPIFAARSTHRYDAIDFHRIDPVLGDRRDVPAMALKGAVGTSGAGAGSLDLAALVMALHHNTLPPSANHGDLASCGARNLSPTLTPMPSTPWHAMQWDS